MDGFMSWVESISDMLGDWLTLAIEAGGYALLLAALCW